MRETSRLFLFLLVVCARAALAADPQPVVLTATFADSVLSVSGVTPGGDLAIDAVLIEPQGDVSLRTIRVERVLTDEDRNGVVEFDSGRKLPIRGIVGLVDVASGGYLVATPPGYDRHETPFPANVRRGKLPDQFDELAHDYLILQVLWVRPGVGAWVGTTADGGAGDADGKNNGQTVMSLDYLRSPGNRPVQTPKKFKAGDVVLFIDPFAFTFAATKVTK